MINSKKIINKASDIEKITREDLPSLYHVASLKSAKKKNIFFFLIKTNLILLAIGTLSTSIFIINKDRNQIQSFISYLSFFSLLISLCITLFLQLKEYDKEWYGARAIAESIKTLSWRFMMCSDKFNGQTQEEVTKLFINDINKIKNESRYLAGVLGGTVGEKPLITELMFSIRKLSFNERLKLYLKYRIEVQRNWYLESSKEKEDNGDICFIYIFIFEILALITLFLYIVNPTLLINPSALFITIVTSLLTWSQVKQFKILSQSYGFTGHELNSIITLGTTIKSEKELSKFVIDSEQAISREHTMWRARKVEI